MKHQLILKQLPARCVLLCLGLGVSLEVAAGLVTTAGEGACHMPGLSRKIQHCKNCLRCHARMYLHPHLPPLPGRAGRHPGGNCRSSRLRRPGDETMPETGEMGHEKITSGRVNFPPNLSFTPDFQLFLQFPIIKCV